jgi:Zn-dependent protease with chaperone function
MSMTRENFEERVARLEVYSRKHPAAYRRNVFLLALLGYMFSLFLLGCILATGGLLIWALWYTFKIGFSLLSFKILEFTIVLVLFLWAILGTLKVSLPSPEGFPLKRKQAEPLFRMIEEVRKKLKVPRVHQVLITEDFNAGLLQQPRLGFLGWNWNFLMIGLPLMGALSEEQLRSVIAHELGHLSGNHSRFGGMIYRLRLTWFQLLSAHQRKKMPGQFLFRWFLNWYVPLFNAYTFVFSRANEYMADRCSIEVAGLDAASRGLLRSNIVARYLEWRFWQRVEKKAWEQPAPIRGVFQQMFKAFRQDMSKASQQLWLEQALSLKADSGDTHPSLVTRLETMGLSQEPGGPLRDEWGFLRVPEAPGQTAAETLLPLDLLNRISGYFSRKWAESVRPKWEERYDQAHRARERLRELEQRAEVLKLPQHDAWERAQLALELDKEDKAYRLMQEYVREYPEDLNARYEFGSFLLRRGDKQGVEEIEHVMEHDPESVLPGCETIYSFLMERGESEGAKEYVERIQEMYARMEEDHLERTSLSTRDTFEPHEVPYRDLRPLMKELESFSPYVKVAYLVRKKLTIFSHRPLYVLGVAARKPTLLSTLSLHDIEQELIESLRFQFQHAGSFYVILLNRENNRYRQIFSRTPGARIYAFGEALYDEED